ncbi:unnamed protein product [Caenorhabditis brenneri]
MRLTSLHILVFLVLQCNGKSNFKTIIGLYCPNKTDWDWNIDFHKSLIPSNPLASRHGHAKGKFQYVEIDLDNFGTFGNGTKLVYMINENCTNDGRGSVLFLEFPLFPDRITYGFIAVDLLTRLDTNAYEQLFIQYLKGECPTGDCSSVLERIDCSYHSISNSIDKCKEGLEKAVRTHSATTIHSLQINNSSTPTLQAWDTSTFVIFGAAVGVVLIIVGFIACFFCKKSSKSGPNPSGMTSGTETKSGKSAKTTKTGESQKTEGTGTKTY